MKDAADKVWENARAWSSGPLYEAVVSARSLNDGSNLYGYSLAQTIVAVLGDPGII